MMDSKKEILQGLLDGKRYNRHNWRDPMTRFKYIQYDTNYNLMAIYKDDVIEVFSHDNIYNPEEWEEYAEPEWYDDIPLQGVLCQVDYDSYEVIVEYDYIKRQFISTSRKRYTTARPLEDLEIQQLFF